MRNGAGPRKGALDDSLNVWRALAALLALACLALAFVETVR